MAGRWKKSCHHCHLAAGKVLEQLYRDGADLLRFTGGGLGVTIRLYSFIYRDSTHSPKTQGTISAQSRHRKFRPGLTEARRAADGAFKNRGWNFKH